MRYLSELVRNFSSRRIREGTRTIPEIKSDFRSWGDGGGGKVTLLREGSMARLILDNPSKRNAVSGVMMCQLHDAALELEKLAEKGLRSLLVSSTGPFFCSGGEQETVQRIMADPDGPRAMTSLMHDTSLRIVRLPLVSATYIQGGAIGGGAEIPLWTDFRAFHREEGKIGFVQSRMGVSPGWGSGARLVKLIGKQRAARLLLFAEIIKATEAVNVGLCDILVDSEEEAKCWLVEKLNHLETGVARQIKRLLNEAQDSNDLMELLSLEGDISVSLWGGPAQVRAYEKKIKHR